VTEGESGDWVGGELASSGGCFMQGCAWCYRPDTLPVTQSTASKCWSKFQIADTNYNVDKSPEMRPKTYPA